MLEWNPSTGSVAGYLLWYGNQSGSYTTSLAVELTTAELWNLPPGVYFFVVLAYTPEGLYSAPSNELGPVFVN